MENYKERDKKWILEHLKICKYQVKELRYLRNEEFGKNDCGREIYEVKLYFFGEIVKRIVFRHGQCLDMLSKNIQVKDMLGNDNVIFPRKDGEEVKLDKERNPIYNSNINLREALLFYEDYVSLREHFFEEKDLVQLACWVRTDNQLSLDWGKFGRYILTVNVIDK